MLEASLSLYLSTSVLPEDWPKDQDQGQEPALSVFTLMWYRSTLVLWVREQQEEEVFQRLAPADWNMPGTRVLLSALGLLLLRWLAWGNQLPVLFQRWKLDSFEIIDYGASGTPRPPRNTPTLQLRNFHPRRCGAPNSGHRYMATSGRSGTSTRTRTSQYRSPCEKVQFIRIN